MQHMFDQKFLYDGVRYYAVDRIEDIIPQLRAAVRKQGEAVKAVAHGM
jgi:hypothetical protein